MGTHKSHLREETECGTGNLELDTNRFTEARSNDNDEHSEGIGDLVPQVMPRNTTGISNKTSSTLSTTNLGMDEAASEAILPMSQSQEHVVTGNVSALNATAKQLVDLSGRLGLVLDDISPVLRPHSVDADTITNLGVRGGIRLVSEPIVTVVRSLSASYPQRRGSGYSRDSSGGRTENTNGATQGSAGNWGWFEDVHNEAGSGNSPKHASMIYDKENDYGNFDDEDEASVKRKERKSGGGLLQFSASTVQPLEDIRSESTEQETMAVSAPTYVLEESISSQKLWRKTAGNRPPQPVEERAYFEEIWAHNFLQSQVNYHAPLEVLVASSPISMSPYADVGFGDSNDVGNNYITVGHYHNPTVFGGAGGDLKRANKYVEVAAAEASLAQRSMCNNNINSANKKIQSSGEGTLSVLIKGDNIFGTTVSKSFARADRSGRIDTISISIASYRVVQSKKFGKYAQFLVVYREGSFQNTVGVWKRYSDFDSLARKVTGGQESCSSLLAQITPFAVHDDLDDNEVDKEILPNAVTSWRLLKKRQRWFRCLDAGYLSLKVFLLERFLHDILFETSNPQILRDFIGVDFLQ